MPDPGRAQPAPSQQDGKLAAKLAAGGLSCMIVSSVLNPMDVIKIALQIQNQLKKARGLGVGHAEGEYKGFRHAAVKIASEEGVFRGLMKGITASMMREASYSSMRLGLYDLCKRVFAPNVQRTLCRGA